MPMLLLPAICDSVIGYFRATTDDEPNWGNTLLSREFGLLHVPLIATPRPISTAHLVAEGSGVAVDPFGPGREHRSCGARG